MATHSTGFNQGRKAATKDIIEAIDDFLLYDYPDDDDDFVRGMKKAREIVKDWGADNAENKTCPFCGSDSVEVHTHYGESAGLQYGGYYPECTVCGCRLGYYETREDALNAWNERNNKER